MRYSKELFLLGVFCFAPLRATLAAEAPQYLVVNPSKGISVRAGKAVETTISVTIAPEFHIQANPASRPNLIPTSLDFPEKEGILLEKVEYPQGQSFRLQGSDQEIMVYNGEARFKVKFRAKTAKPGKWELKGTLKYQPCNKETCFFPNRVSFVLPIQVLK